MKKKKNNAIVLKYFVKYQIGIVCLQNTIPFKSLYDIPTQNCLPNSFQGGFLFHSFPGEEAGNSPKGLQAIMTYVLNVFRNLGLSQLKNSNLNPSQEVEYLGAVFNLDFLTLTLPESKVDRIVSFAQDTLLLHQCFRRHLESFIHS